MLQTGAPVYVPSLTSTEPPIRLSPSRDTSGQLHQHNEAFLRDLIHRAPDLLPIAEIEPIFDSARSVCIELPNPAGFVDNLLVTPEGGVVLVECKLQRNLQARREVIAQIMDYAAQLQSWTFEDLDSAVRRAELPTGGKPAGLVEAFEHVDDFDEIAFRDAITRNLRRGRMLLLVVGDGIREGLESLAGIVQRHPGFHAALGLVELKLFPLPEGGFIVQPRTLLRTLNIERGVVTFSDDRIAIASAPQSSEVSSETSSSKRATSLSEEEFYGILAGHYSDGPKIVKSMVARLETLGLYPEFERSLIMRWTGIDGREHNVINFRKGGRVHLDPLSWLLKTEEELAIATAFRQRIAEAVGGEVRGGRNNQNIWIGDRIITLDALSHHEDACVDAVQWLLHQFHELERSQEG